MAQIDMKLYSKIVLFYYDMLKRAMQLINSN